jgi:very-short-patch-repair endonuclease
VKHALARQFRRRQTDAEEKLWRALRMRRLAGMKFRRQQPFGPFIVDFICFDAKLIVELDGEQHRYERKLRHDLERTAYFTEHGYRVRRYWNSAVYEDIDRVLRDIGSEVQRRNT